MSVSGAGGSGVFSVTWRRGTEYQKGESIEFMNCTHIGKRQR
jgi:hypothetical protein